METAETGNIFDLVKLGNENDDRDVDCSISISCRRTSDEGGEKTETAKKESENDEESWKLKRKQKTARELKKLAFDNKKFNLDASDADYTCVGCGQTFLYESQLKSHSVYDHSRSRLVSDTSPLGRQTVIRYQCNVCSKLICNVQSYLDHFEFKSCKDHEKRRLKTFDSCVCILCGYATTRSQLSSHLRDGHAGDTPTLKPTNKEDSVYACPMCISDGGGSVVVASGVDLLLHLSTWHPTAVTLDRGPPIPNEDFGRELEVKEPINEDEQGVGECDETTPNGYRFCVWCQEQIPRPSYPSHRIACFMKNTYRPSASTSNSTKRLLKTAKRQRKPLFPVLQKSLLSALKPASLQKLKKRRGSSNGGINGDYSGDLQIERQSTSSDTSESPVTTTAVWKSDFHNKITSVWARAPKPRNKLHCCTNCRKEFSDSLGYFVHLVSRFCFGNRGQLQLSCPLCKESLNAAPAVLEHIRRRHCGPDGLRVDKSLRIEFSELASELIGFLNICQTCCRGFQRKTRCNTSKAHLGSKVPIQDVLICKLCSQRLKSSTHLILHLWSMHEFEGDAIAIAMKGGLGTNDRIVKIETISEAFARRAYDATKFDVTVLANVPSVLKCSSCMTRFASMAALVAHNTEFHDSFRKNDNDFHTVAKVFYYRQAEWKRTEGSLFDGLFSNKSTLPTASTSVVDSSNRFHIAPTVGNGTPEVLPILINHPTDLDRKRKQATPPKDVTPAKKDKPEITIIGSLKPPPPVATTVTIPSPALPRLVRISDKQTTTREPDLITLDGDDPDVEVLTSGKAMEPVKLNIRNSYLSAVAPPNVVALSMAGQAPTTPVLLRAYSLKTATASVPQLVMASSSASFPRLVLTNHSALKIQTAPIMVARATAPKSATTRMQLTNGVQQKQSAVQLLRMPMAPIVVSMPTMTASTDGGPRSRIVIRAIAPDASTNQAGK